MSKAYVIDSFRSIKRTISRFISIVAIVALGSSLFVGLNAVCPDMMDTADTYYKTNNLCDIRLQTYLGLYEEDLTKIRQLEGVKAVQGAKFVDGYVQTPDEESGEYKGIVDIDGSELTVRVTGFNTTQAIAFSNGENDENYINRLSLKEGRYPENEHECLVTCSSLTTPDEFKIGNKIKVLGDDEEISYYLKENEFEIVGIIQTPYWISYERGATTAGSGKLGDFVYVSNSAFTDKIGYYSEAYVTLTNSDKFTAYTDSYNNYVEAMQKRILEASDAIVKNRAAVLSVGLAEKVSKGALEISNAEGSINAKLDEARKTIDEYKELEKTGAQKLEDAQKELETKYAAAQAQLQGGSDQYIAAVNEYNEKVTAVSTGKIELANKQLEYNTNKAAADSAKQKLDEANIDLKLAKTEITATETLINSTKSTLKTLQDNQNVAQSDLDLDAMAQRLQETNPELAKILLSASDLTAQGMAADAIVEIEALLDQYQSELVVAKENFTTGQQEYNSKYSQWSSADAQLKSAKIQLDDAERTLTNAETQLAQYKDEIEASGSKLQYGSITAQTEYMTAQAQLALKTTQLQNIKATLAEAEKKFAASEASANQQLGLAKTEYQKGKTLLDNINSDPCWFVYSREDSPGYSGYGQASENMQRLAYIFPTFFFIVSTLICLTTMTRMVEEERTQLGTLKALGYSNKMISGKYLLYAAFASVLGVAIGVAVGFFAFPKAIFAAWSIMYEMPTLTIKYIISYIILCVIISIGSTMLAAYLACRTELKSVPAVLMRPKPPKAGKRVFLENIKFIWSRLSFTSKVTVRNLFRNKKRFAVTVIGIAGCTALLLASFGLRDSMGSVISDQYGEDGVAQYDLQVVLKDGQESYAGSSLVSQINSVEGIESSMLGYLKVCTGSSDRSENTLEVDVLVPETPGTLNQFVNVARNGDTVPLTDDGAIITKKLADKTKTNVGDMLTLSWTEGSKQVEYQIKVAGIADNYTFHYVYITPQYFSSVTGKTLSYNYLFCKITEGVSAEYKTALENAVNNLDGINGTVFTTVVIDNFNNIINSLNIVVLVLIFAAMALAIIVLYNLNNINVNERIRELATLKVLGFYDGEVSAYIYRENVFLIIIGILVGLIMGVGLHLALVGIVDIDTLTFSTSIKALSFVYSAVLTIIFAVFVNLLMHFKLKKISMVESLKSVE